MEHDQSLLMLYFKHLCNSCLVKYIKSYLVVSTIVLYYIMTRADTAKYGRMNILSTLEPWFFHILNPGILVLEEQVAVGLYYILTGSYSSQTEP